MSTKTTPESEHPWNRVETPVVTREGLRGEKHTHPAFGTISASRVRGQANLFGSNVGHSGFVKISIHPAEMYRDGYSENIHGSLSTIAEAAEQYRRAQISGTPEDKRAASEALDRAYRNMGDHAGGAA